MGWCGNAFGVLTFLTFQMIERSKCLTLHNQYSQNSLSDHSAVLLSSASLRLQLMRIIFCTCSGRAQGRYLTPQDCKIAFSLPVCMM